MLRLRVLTTTVATALLLTHGCAKKTSISRAAPPLAETADVATPVSPPLQPAPDPAESDASATTPLSEEELFARKTLDELNAERPLGDVFFDFDQTSIREDARDTLQANAAWLRRWPTTRVTIEGHADDLGTSEYNLALGTRRATAIRDYLTGLGVESERLSVLSRGEESPVCSTPDEVCRQQNRRGHTVITAK